MKDVTAKSGRKYRSIPDDIDVETWDAMTIIDRLQYKGLLCVKEKSTAVTLDFDNWIDARWVINNAMASIDQAYEKGSVRHNEMLALHKELEDQLKEQVGEEYNT